MLNDLVCMGILALRVRMYTVGENITILVGDKGGMFLKKF